MKFRALNFTHLLICCFISFQFNFSWGWIERFNLIFMFTSKLFNIHRVGFVRFVRTVYLYQACCVRAFSKCFYGLFALRVYSLYFYPMDLCESISNFRVQINKFIEKRWQKTDTHTHWENVVIKEDQKTRIEKEKKKWKVQSLTTSSKTMEMASTYAHLRIDIHKRFSLVVSMSFCRFIKIECVITSWKVNG